MTKRPIPVPTSPADIATLLHEAVVYGRTIDGHLVIGRRRPYIPAGTDPADINRECARRYEVVAYMYGPVRIVEIDPADVVPFIDIPAQLAAADVHANRAQRTNKRGAGR